MVNSDLPDFKELSGRRVKIFTSLALLLGLIKAQKNLILSFFCGTLSNF